MSKHVFFDIDGTLINFNGIVPESAKEAIRTMRANGHKAIICSGRSLHQISDWMREDFDAVVYATGAAVAYRNKIIYEHFVPCGDVALLRKTMEAAGANLIAQADERAVLSKTSYDFMQTYLRKIGKSEERINIMLGNALITDTMEECPLIRKFFYNSSKKTVSELNAELGHIFNFEASSFGTTDPGSGEITCLGINKSFGMQKYLEYTGGEREDTIAIGDGPNDLDMMGFAGIGVAMGNACELVKEKADFVTKHIDEDGIAFALKELGLI